jgi:hypothetical protein
MSQPFINCSLCSIHMSHLVNFDINLCYTCDIKSKKQMSDEEFFNLHPQPKELSRIICINTSETVEEYLCDLNMPEIKRGTAIDNCKDDPLILKKNDDLYVSCGLIKEIKSSITFDVVPNCRYNETTERIEKIDPTIEEEDRRLIVLQRNPNAILEEEFERNMLKFNFN